MKTALLAATTLITLATSSQAGPSWQDVLADVATVAAAVAGPQQVYVVRPGACYVPARPVYYQPAPRVVYYQPAPRVVYYAQPVQRCNHYCSR